MKTRKLSLTLGLFTALLCLAAGAAWACTPGGALDPIAPSAGAPPGADITVSGRNFRAGLPVEIRWNSIDGPVVGTATGPEFSTTATVPAKAEQGVHYVIALQKDSGGNVAMKMTETFDVIAGPGAGAHHGGDAVPSDLWSGFTRNSSMPEAEGQNAGQVLPGSSIAGSALAIGGLAVAGLSVALIARRRSAGRGT